jgi:antitoxin PrlF
MLPASLRRRGEFRHDFEGPQRWNAIAGKVLMPYIVRCVRERAMASTLTVTAKGQVTLRKDILKHLGIEPGSKVEVDLLPNGRAELRAAQKTSSIADSFGMLYRPGTKTLTLDEIKEAIEKGWAGEL